MRIIILLIIIFLKVSFSIAQDNILFDNGSSESVKIIKIGTKRVQYKSLSNPDGPVYKAEMKDIAAIEFEDGSIRVFNAKHPDLALSNDFNPNLLSYHLMDILFDDFTLSYERIIKDGLWGIQVPVGIGFNKNYDYNYERKDNSFYSGIAMYYYPTGQKKWTYYVGPEFRFGIMKDQYLEQFWDDNGFFYEDNVDVRSLYSKMFVRNGIMFTPVSNFSISFNFGLGIKYYEIDGYFERTAHAALNLSCRF